MENIATESVMKWLFRMAQRVPMNIAPECQEKLASDIFGPEKWTISWSNEPANFFAIPQDKAIYLSAAGQASLWCLAYTAFHVMDVASRTQRATSYDAHGHLDIGQYYSALHLGEYVAFSRSLFHADRPWPKNLEMPSEGPAQSSNEWRINNIYLGALSWIMLHEIAHVHHQDQKFVPDSLRIKQEYLADGFATDWILSSAGQGLEREFRILMIAVALTWSFLSESELGQGNTHPATILRFREVAERFKAGERSVGLENATYLLKAVLDPATVPPAHETPEQAFEWISGRLEAMFPA